MFIYIIFQRIFMANYIVVWEVQCLVLFTLYYLLQPILLHDTRPNDFACMYSYGHIDVLVNNAGIQPPASCVPLHQLSSNLWKRVLAVNLDSVFFVSKAVRYTVSNASRLCDISMVRLSDLFCQLATCPASIEK